MIECDARRATPQSLMVIRTLGGAIDRVDADANACLGAARLAKQADSPQWEPNACLGAARLAKQADSPQWEPDACLGAARLAKQADSPQWEHSAYAHRGARYNLSIDAGWTDPALDEAAIGWARSSWTALRPFATGGVYVNFAGLDEESGRDAVFGESAQRLDEIQATYDPEGIFRAASRRP